MDSIHFVEWRCHLDWSPVVFHKVRCLVLSSLWRELEWCMASNPNCYMKDTQLYSSVIHHKPLNWKRECSCVCRKSGCHPAVYNSVHRSMSSYGTPPYGITLCLCPQWCKRPPSWHHPRPWESSLAAVFVYVMVIYVWWVQEVNDSHMII